MGGVPFLTNPRFLPQTWAMVLLTSEEFLLMEQLLADLLPSANAEEEVALLNLHTRLQTVFEAQSNLHASHDRLSELRSQTGK